MEVYSTLSEAISGLRKEGYSEDFKLKQKFIECSKGTFKIFHDEFVIDKYFHFEENADPSHQSIIYAISFDKYGLKGILINGYGIYTASMTNEILEKLNADFWA
jgi:hypothetical protein